MANVESSNSVVTAAGKRLSRAPAFLRQQLWIWPLVAAAMLVFVGFWVRGRMERGMEAQIGANLKTVLDANTEALREWAASEKSLAELLAGDDRVRQYVVVLLQRVQESGVSAGALLNAPELRPLHAYLQPAAERRGFRSYAILDTNFVTVAAGRQQIIGMKPGAEYVRQFERCLSGQAVVTRPFPSPAPLPDEAGNLRTGLPLMFVVAPIRSAEGKVIAALGLPILPERDFTRILATARAGRSGETYAFDHAGLLLSQSRFDDDLKRFNLIPDLPDARSILSLELRDPLVDLRKGVQSPKRRADLPLITPVREALAGRSGVNASGYRDYRGVVVVGAWTWLPEYEFGLVTQQDRTEAVAPVRPIRTGFWIIFGFLTVGSAVVYVLMRVARRAALKATRLGQYTLDDEIGSGGFGTVYRGHHALLRRPVAVKVLSPFADEAAIARFKREVQMTCQLTHPNTIALYDYGHTPDGLFYYAMEYLDGLALNRLIHQHGPQPEGRVIHILRQVCASLAEAHASGLVHRDIKPHNIFLTRRGGIPDFVKVLDFGLVKARSLEGQIELTAPTATLGTPLYMSPEAVDRPDKVDALSDLYSLGAVGYELLTGQPVFFGSTIGEIMLQQVRSQPERPSVRLKHPVSRDLEDLLMQCLAKKPSARPASAAALEEALGRCSASVTWTRQTAEEWWRAHPAVQDAKTTAGPET